ncbi:glycosyl transferase family 4-domain-containing protein [Entophlyctis helioformis]|nr:glycosyl transferase family 4-domain-containing protein [Entophlyctis helioformis]
MATTKVAGLARSAALPGTLFALGASLVYQPLAVSLILGTLAGIFTSRAIPACSDLFIRSGRFGKDLLKANKPVIAESMGAIVGVVYFIAMFVFIPVAFFPWIGRGMYVEGVHPPFPHDKFAQYLGGLLALFSMLFLGFADDVFDIRWRVKIWFPLIASLPLLMVYFVTYGKTDVLVPLPLRFLFPAKIIHLGGFYYLYMAALVIFSTNAINIVAGANGVEGGQSLVIAVSIALNDVIQLHENPARSDAHLNSLYFLIPFIGVTLGYLRHNWYPAKAFGGDTYAYFAGMTFAVVGILGNFSKTVVLFMIPQIFNFLYSCPQLFKFVECPRHRMPRLDEKLGKVVATRFTFEKAKPLGILMIRFLELLGLADVTRDPRTGKMIDCSNLTIMNLLLVRLGPMSESDLVVRVMVVQAASSLVGFVVRYGLAHIVYNRDE